MGQRRALRPQPDDPHFGSLITLALMAVAFLLIVWVATKALFVRPGHKAYPASARQCRAQFGSNFDIVLPWFYSMRLSVEGHCPALSRPSPLTNDLNALTFQMAHSSSLGAARDR